MAQEKYLTINDKGALDGREKKEMREGHKECEKCLGYGGWNLRLDAYGKGKHFRAGCPDCNGWGNVPEELQEYQSDKFKRVKAIFDGKLSMQGGHKGMPATKHKIVTLLDNALLDQVDNDVLMWFADGWHTGNFGGVVKKLASPSFEHKWSVEVYID